MAIAPKLLKGRTVSLVPTELSHAAQLAEAIEVEYFKHYLQIRPRSESVGDVSEFLSSMMDLPNTLVHTIFEVGSGRAIGTTSYMDIREEHRGLEIGMTWINRDFWGSRVNPECKYLLLGRAFEELEMVRVQLKTGSRNLHSRAAILKLGAAFEGVLRSQGIQPDGSRRDTAMYSILDDEWPEVKARLASRLEDLA